ncbi:MAG: carboxypeptidase-like regulatory domain-containing protein [Candidatus Micrarchaeota archaeon]|nr:carboxypeptidase-like regulatory domain-containing protein [Candidatus Micrarchaeota archaeon]
MGRATGFAFSLLLLTLLVDSSTLAVKVTVAQETLAVGTNVSVISGGVELYNAKADRKGMAYFNLTDGSYFIKLERYSYPKHVALVEVKGDTDVTLTMRQKISYATIYGQVFGKDGFSDVEVRVYSGDKIAARAIPNKDGYFVVSFLAPRDYVVSVSAPGYEEVKREVTLNLGDFVQVNADLKASPPKAEPQLSIVAPDQAPLKSLIEIAVVKGETPVAGQRVVVKTPSGELSVDTDAQGKARVNAAESGEYVFVVGNLTQSVLVPAPQNTGPVPEPKGNAQGSPQRSEPAKAKEEEAPAWWGIAAFAGAALLLAIFLIVLWLAWKWLEKKRSHREKKAHKEWKEERHHKKHHHKE